MEVTKEKLAISGGGGGGILDKILPPRLEDAGLEDCALPPESIKEAFFKAASAVKSRAASIFAGEEEEEGVPDVLDPFPEQPSDALVGGGAAPPGPGLSDALVGVEAGMETPAPGPCAVEKGGGVVEEGRDEVVVGGGDLEEREEGKGGCVGGDGGGGVKKKGRSSGGEEEEEEDEKRPTLTEGFV
ncbi:hypothetical protein Tsubulata_031996 [Turnera subulata]|uniref:Uncharacterized protein n=1 Tax=Turnera subulata TaxID=218843 RepID=A0A9Q0FQ89_9ROSI|nr:hypothetical protein Tsubulata_031996 [Turnera subulata]